MKPQAEGEPAVQSVRRSRAKEWSRSAWALAALFASLPVACRIFAGVWGFEGATELSVLCLMAGAYFHLRGRKSVQVPDSAMILDQALGLAQQGQTDAAIALLTEAIRLSPRLWQAFQYRGELQLSERHSAGAALDDLDEAIRLAPEEPELYSLRGKAYELAGNEPRAQRDYERAAALRAGGSDGPSGVG
jgi:tetratricopeptide (TPR) repeat protein